MIFYSCVFRELLKVQSKISYAKENEKNTIDTWYSESRKIRKIAIYQKMKNRDIQVRIPQ